MDAATLKVELRARGISHEQAAQFLGLTRSRVTQMLNGGLSEKHHNSLIRLILLVEQETRQREALRLAELMEAAND